MIIQMKTFLALINGFIANKLTLNQSKTEFMLIRSQQTKVKHVSVDPKSGKTGY